jgi:hypothetical protein
MGAISIQLIQLVLFLRDAEISLLVDEHLKGRKRSNKDPNSNVKLFILDFFEEGISHI